MVENITEITTHYMKKHVESRWLSANRSLVRILEQMENLRECFLKEINQKNGLVNNDRYKRTASVLKDTKAEICMPFVVFISQSFNRFLKPLQTSLPVIHWLCKMCLKLVHELLDKVIKETLRKKEGKSVPAKKLKEIELQNKETQKVFHLTFKSLHLLNLKWLVCM